MSELVAAAIGLDLSTTGLAMWVRSAEGQDGSASVKIRGETRWNGQPAFFLQYLPDMFSQCLKSLQTQGWTIRPGAASISSSVRQHDLVIVGPDGAMLIPALSWQCNAATDEVAALRKLGAENTVGKIEPRFILPKLMWALKQSAGLVGLVSRVMTTGDYLAWQLTGQLRLSTSDALSNALLDQQSKQLATNVFSKAELPIEWFPPVIQSGEVVGLISPAPRGLDAWSEIRSQLSGWSVAAGLGDNHASALGCGLAGTDTIVISAGSSGTICRLCPPDAPLEGEAVCFEYFHDRLLLMMLADCAVWYDRFVKETVEQPDYAELNQAALKADLRKLVRVTQAEQGAGRQEAYPKGWESLGLPEKVASTQFSIALELLERVRLMLREVKTDSQGSGIKRFVITGGLARSPFLQGVMQEGLGLLSAPGEPKVMINATSDSNEFKAAAYGAMLNATLRGNYDKLPSLIQELVPLEPCRPLSSEARPVIRDMLSTHLR